MKNIGALILTKNNSSTISATINSVSAVCSQVVVLDTGSSDNTPSIATRFGAEVYFFKWIDDFSIARNEAKKYLHTDWILMIDSDEILSDFDINEFQKIATNPNIAGINFIIENSLSENGNHIINSHRYTRLFQNKPEIKFVGRIHEQIRDSIETNNYEIYESNFKILHLGYSKTNYEKFERNQTLLEKDLADNPQDDWLKYHLANTHFSAGKDDEAIKLFSEIITSPQLSEEQSEIVRLRLAQLSLKYDNYDAVQKLCNFNSKYPQNEALRLYIIGTSYLFTNKIKEAHNNFIKCLEINSPVLNQNDVLKALDLAKKMMR